MGSIPIYKLHMNSLASTMWQGVIYTDDNDANTNDDANNDDNTAQLH